MILVKFACYFACQVLFFVAGQPTVRLKVGLRSTDVVASGPPFPVQSPCVDSYTVDGLGGAHTIHCENDNSTGRFLVVQVIDTNQGIRLRGMQAFQCKLSL